MKTIVDRRTPEAGYVYVGETRMRFVPGHTMREIELPKNSIVLYQANWGPVTALQASACRNALKRAYPDKQIILT